MRLKDDNKRIYICQAAIELICKIGFGKTTMSKIAKAAGVSPSTIYIYFKNKDDMLNKVYMYAKTEFMKSLGIELNSDKSPKPIQKMLKDVYYGYYETYKKSPVLVSFCEQFAHSPLIKKVSKEFMDTYQKEINKFINEGINKKILGDINPILIPFLFIAPLERYLKEMQLLGIKPNDEHVETLYKLSWKSISR